MIGIQMATKDNFIGLVDLLYEFAGEGLDAYGVKLDPDKAKESLETLLEKQNVIAMIDEDKNEVVGSFIGVVTESLFSNDHFLSNVLFYIKPAYRRYTKRFIRQIEHILQQTTVTRLIIGNMYSSNGEKLERFYKMMGFKKLETHYIRAV